MAFEGSCHCGAVRFSVDADPPENAVSCNCSHCRRKGFLLAFYPAETFTLASGADVLRPYTFNTHKIEHQFCGTCGTEAFAYGANPDGSPIRAINRAACPRSTSMGLRCNATMARAGNARASPHRPLRADR